MDYKKKYEQALERARQVHTTNVDENKKSTEYIFPELKESEDERIRKHLIKHFGNKSKEDWNGVPVKSILAWLEKQGEQKPTDKAEPKFKAGDWVVPNNGEPRVFRVEERGWPDSIISGSLGSQYVNTFTLDKQYHLWSIQDAKDGDVLTCYSDIKGQPIEQTGIVKQYVGRHGGCSNSFKVHFGIDFDNYVVIEGYMGSSDIYPSTREQRDLLFSKMKEAGYKWDSEKKELKKIDTRENLVLDGDLMQADCMMIEQKPARSEEDEDIFNDIIEDVMPYGECPDYPTDEEREYFYEGNRKVEWLKSLKDRMKGE